MHLRDHIEHLKAKPEHVRRQIALSVAGGITGVVALTWATALINSDTFALTTGGFTATVDSTAGLAAATKDIHDEFGVLVGAAAAASGATNENNLTVVETRASSTVERVEMNDETRTSIPF